MKTCTFFITVCSILFLSCKKIPGDNTNIAVECAGVKGTKIVPSKTIYNPGDDIHLGINASNPSGNDYISWYSASETGQLGTGKSLDISDCGKADQGLYIMSISNADCGKTYSDSIYITVENATDTAPCALANNAVTFSAIPDISPAALLMVQMHRMALKLFTDMPAMVILKYTFTLTNTGIIMSRKTVSIA